MMNSQNTIKIDAEGQRHLNAYIDYTYNTGLGDKPFSPEVKKNPLRKNFKTKTIGILKSNRNMQSTSKSREKMRRIEYSSHG
jgi:hypothetical protein